jgi:hypothetical protein
LILKKVVSWLKAPNLSGSVIDQAGQPLPNTVLRLNHPETGLLESLVTTNDQGVFEAFVEPNVYQLSVMKAGYIWEHDAALSMYQVDLRSGSQELVVSMQPATGLISDLLAPAA